MKKGTPFISQDPTLPKQSPLNLVDVCFFSWLIPSQRIWTPLGPSLAHVEL